MRSSYHQLVAETITISLVIHLNVLLGFLTVFSIISVLMQLVSVVVMPGAEPNGLTLMHRHTGRRKFLGALDIRKGLVHQGGLDAVHQGRESARSSLLAQRPILAYKLRRHEARDGSCEDVSASAVLRAGFSNLIDQRGKRESEISSARRPVPHARIR
jgi:hypothetical protein